MTRSPKLKNAFQRLATSEDPASISKTNLSEAASCACQNMAKLRARISRRAELVLNHRNRGVVSLRLAAVMQRVTVLHIEGYSCRGRALVI
jgi:hypothetical protein